jgi:hypothetical protein
VILAKADAAATFKRPELLEAVSLSIELPDQLSRSNSALCNEVASIKGSLYCAEVSKALSEAIDSTSEKNNGDDGVSSEFDVNHARAAMHVVKVAAQHAQKVKAKSSTHAESEEESSNLTRVESYL